MRKSILAAFGAVALGVALLAQSAPPAAAPSTYKSAAEINEYLAKADINSKTGGAITISKGVVVRRRGAARRNTRSSIRGRWRCTRSSTGARRW